MNLRPLILCILVVGSFGCAQPSHQERGERTREIVADATEKAKPTLQWLGTKVGQASKWAAEESVAFAEGVFEGWFRANPSSSNLQSKTDLNAATERELLKLPNMSSATARRIEVNRPFRSTRELVSKGIISVDAYKRIRDLVEVK
jgi:DNA uptake protein ComE-like DNA-binding protein